MKKSIDTTIVTILYNSETVLEDFFRSLDAQTYRDFRLYVVDNHSPDWSLSVARMLAGDVGFETVIMGNDRNTGVADGNNRGVRRALDDGCRWILLSNNDTVFNPSTLEKLMEVRREERMTAPKILIHSSERIWYAGGNWNRLTGGTRHQGYGRKDGPPFNIPEVVAYAPTCCLLVPASIFKTIGPMDERFFVYYDDTDFMYRCNRAGIKVQYNPAAVVYHKESISTGGNGPFAQYYLSRNLIFFSRKHYRRVRRWAVYAVHLLVLAKRSVA